jgi:hypothetical protein
MQRHRAFRPFSLHHVVSTDIQGEATSGVLMLRLPSRYNLLTDLTEQAILEFTLSMSKHAT